MDGKAVPLRPVKEVDEISNLDYNVEKLSKLLKFRHQGGSQLNQVFRNSTGFKDCNIIHTLNNPSCKGSSSVGTTKVLITMFLAVCRDLLLRTLEEFVSIGVDDRFSISDTAGVDSS